MNYQVKTFFDNSEYLLELSLIQLEHIRSNWDLYWDDSNMRYSEEEDSFAKELNELIIDIASAEPPKHYHDNEDILVGFYNQNCQDKAYKEGNLWKGEGYKTILEQGGFEDYQQADMVQAAAGRVKAALDRSQYNIDSMEKGHRQILCDIIANILYHRHGFD